MIHFCVWLLHWKGYWSGYWLQSQCLHILMCFMKEYSQYDFQHSKPPFYFWIYQDKNSVFFYTDCIYVLLAVSPRHACGWKGGDLNKKSIHEIVAPYITPSIQDFHHSSYRSTYQKSLITKIDFINAMRWTFFYILFIKINNITDSGGSLSITALQTIYIFYISFNLNICLCYPHTFFFLAYSISPFILNI